VQEEDDFGAMPRPVLQKPAWLAAWESAAVLPLILRAGVGGAARDGADPERVRYKHTIASIDAYEINLNYCEVYLTTLGLHHLS
jgi:hypothetical protein